MFFFIKKIKKRIPNEANKQVSYKSLFFKKELKKLSTNLHSLNNKEGAIQLNKLEEKKVNIKNILGDTFNSNGITYIQYMDVVNDVYLGIIDNLKKHCLIIEILESIDSNYLFRKIKKGNWHNKTERDTLQHRFNLSEEYVSDAIILLFNNDKALLELDFLAAEVIATTNKFHRVSLAKERLCNLSKKIQGNI